VECWYIDTYFRELLAGRDVNSCTSGLSEAKACMRVSSGEGGATI
jgi:hypothetical protein